MDPVSHGLVGMVLGLMGGGTLSLSNGLMTAAIVGSVIPDLDILFQLRGDYAYIKQHRGFSHSLPSAVGSSCLGAFFLGIFYPGVPLITLFAWFLLGFFSHLLLDMFNSYGVKIFWPLSRKKFTLNLLPLIDPIVLLISIIAIFTYRAGVKDFPFLLVYGCYFLVRWGMRIWAGRIVRRRMQIMQKPHIILLPSGRMSLFQWDFIAMSAPKNIVGNVNLLLGDYRIFQEFANKSEQELQCLLHETALGQIFREFTPYVHINCEMIEGKLVCHFIDLRYRVRNRFMHNGVMVLNEQREVEKAFFLPYSTAHRIYLA
ncbi:MAG: metal-dependent hydrolase [Peptococcia bacterium]|jgi:inner membrane protein